MLLWLVERNDCIYKRSIMTINAKHCRLYIFVLVPSVQEVLTRSVSACVTVSTALSNKLSYFIWTTPKTLIRGNFSTETRKEMRNRKKILAKWQLSGEYYQQRSRFTGMAFQGFWSQFYRQTERRKEIFDVSVSFNSKMSFVFERIKVFDAIFYLPFKFMVIILMCDMSFRRLSNDIAGN